jgi:hypothetical protein
MPFIGMKSYSRAPTFLLATGYEQARSVVPFIAGDIAASERVELELPETGVRSTENVEAASCCGTAPVTADAPVAAASCCSGPAPTGVEACCVDDAAAKAAGEDSCGCGSSKPMLVQIGEIGRRA